MFTCLQCVYVVFVDFTYGRVSLVLVRKTGQPQITSLTMIRWLVGLWRSRAYPRSAMAAPARDGPSSMRDPSQTDGIVAGEMCASPALTFTEDFGGPQNWSRGNCMLILP